MWGWLKPVLDFLRELVGDILKHEVKASDAKTSNETRQRFDTIKSRIKPEAKPDADNRVEPL